MAIHFIGRKMCLICKITVAVFVKKHFTEGTFYTILTIDVHILRADKYRYYNCYKMVMVVTYL